MPSPRALDGVRVIDFSQYMAGPLATELLADMGAEVVKIERPGTGDSARHGSASPFTVGGRRNAFVTLNRGKRSMTIDLKHPDAGEIVRRLADSADVLIENFRPGVMERLGLGPEVVHQRAPHLVYCRITGYGSSEGHTSLPGQDLLVQCATGLTLMNGRDTDPPTPVGPPIVDASAGQLAALAIVSALYERERSGKGQTVAVSLVSAALWLQCQDANLYLNAGIEPRRSNSGIASPNFSAPYGVYRASDGYLAFAHTSLPRLADFLDLPELARWSGPADEFESRDAIHQLLSSRLSERTVAEWLALLRPAGFWVGPVQGYAECFAEFGDEVICSVPDGEAGPLRMLKPPITMDRTPATVTAGPPELGADTSVIAASLGYDDRQIARFISPGGVLAAAVDDTELVGREARTRRSTSAPVASAARLDEE
jgi:crotonobetainyl-CoA:carnitine CoA-transferase CaiB-like acyl-CoA transferase